MTTGSLVSVVIPHYNGSQFLKKAIRSVQAQSWREWEIIIVDDGSAKEHLAFLQSLAANNIQILEQSNQGAASATQRAIDNASGTYIAFLDQDDLWHPQKLDADVRLLEANSTIDLAFSGYQLIDEHEQPLARPHVPQRACFDTNDLFVDFCIGPTSTVTMRAATARQAGTLNASLTCFYDLEFFLRVASCRPFNVGSIPRVLTGYRRHFGQLSSDVPQMKQEWAIVLDTLSTWLHPGDTARRIAQSNMHRYFACLEFERERFTQGCRELAQACLFAPAAFMADGRNWLVASACVAGMVLPRGARVAMQHMVANSCPR